MPLAMQVKLLRVIQEKTFERVGSSQSIYCDVRIISATHRDLEQAIEANTFRQDLYYRLNVVPIQIPALRERSEDIPLLIADLVTRLEREKGFHIQFSDAAIKRLQRYSWPGNVRELANIVERMAILTPEGKIDELNLPDKIPELMQVPDSLQSDHWSAQVAASALTDFPDEGIDLKEHLLSLEQNLIQKALHECDGIVAKAARKLQLKRTTLVEKMRKYGLDKTPESIATETHDAKLSVPNPAVDTKSA
jgi:sigma-54 specific flagellar transcriptional regulator A